MDNDNLKRLQNENMELRGEIKVAHEAAEITAQLVVEQFEETDKVLQLFQTANAQRKAVLDAATRISIIASDLDGRITLFNTGAENLLGYTAEEMVGKQKFDVVHIKSEFDDKARELSNGKHDPPEGLEVLFEYARQGRTDEEWTYARKDGSTFPVNLSVTALRGINDNITGYLNVAVDITERKRAEKEILNAMRIAEDANRTKSSFLASMSHELRTPLNAIIGYSEMLQEDAEDMDLDDFVPDLQKIQTAGKHLLTLINDILDLTKIEAGKMELFLEAFELSELVGDVVSTIKPLVDKNQNKLVVSLQDDLGVMQADVTRTRQILFNLLSNATKFTNNGTINLDVSRKAEEGGEWFYFSVSDTGIGMTQEQLSRVFDAFAQADSSTTRKFGGTGLGLAICRKFCQMMRGDIYADSEEGKGSTFTAKLPVVMEETRTESVEAMEFRESDTGPADTQQPSKGPNTVLVIDDDPIVRDILTRHLSKDGFNVVTAPTGSEGVRLAMELSPIAITLDVMMPGMDGWAVLRELKSEKKLADIPVIMVTIVDDKNLGFALGATDYIIKPVDHKRLLNIVGKFRQDNEVAKVLVVEDDPDTRNLYTRVLEKEGWEVHMAENGSAALQKLSEIPPQVILLDLMMPVMDGFEFLDELRKDKKYRSIPVIVVTAKTITKEDHMRLNGYVKKILQKGSSSRDNLLNDIREQVIKYSQLRQMRSGQKI